MRFKHRNDGRENNKNCFFLSLLSLMKTNTQLTAFQCIREKRLNVLVTTMNKITDEKETR